MRIRNSLRRHMAMYGGGGSMRLFVVGPIVGREDMNSLAFEEVRARLRDAGYYATIPHDVVPPGMRDVDVMRASIRTMLGCDGVALLNGWEESEEAKFECDVATFCGLNVHHFQEWLNKATSWLCGSSQLLSTTPILKEIYSQTTSHSYSYIK